jgi:hypothetical protein
VKSIVIIPGRAPHWVSDHARHLAQRLTETGRVMVVFTHESTEQAMLPGRPGNGSVLGHSVAGYPIWTGRLSAALGVRRRSKVTVVVLWEGANHALALWSALVARIRRERLVLDIAEVDREHQSRRVRTLRRVLRRLASSSVEGEAGPADAGGVRVILALCGDDAAFAHLMMQTFEGMSNSAANRWTLLLQVNPSVRDLAYGGNRRTGKVEVLVGEPSIDRLRMSDVLVAAFNGAFEDFVHQAVLTGGAGVLVGQPVASRVARCHDGVWLAQRNSASILVALEASSGDMFERPGPVASMRHLANEVVRVAEREVAA